MSTVEGFHVPVIPFVDVAGNAGTVPPAQIVKLVPKLNTGTMFGVTVTVNVAVVAHSPAVGVKVYTPEFWLSIDAGFHVPCIPFTEIAGKAGTLAPMQIDKEPRLKVGVTILLTVTAKLAVCIHCPWFASGVNT